MAERDGESIVVTGAKIMAQREALGDLKLYRIPIPVTVAANSQKQVALLEQPTARVETLYRWRSHFGGETGEPASATRILRMENRKEQGLGLPLPAGSFTLYTERGGRPFLLGEGSMTDRAVGETVEVTLDDAPGVRVDQRPVHREGNVRETDLVVTNDQPRAVRFETRFDDEQRPLRTSERLARRDGAWWWVTNVPANSSQTLTIRFREN